MYKKLLILSFLLFQLSNSFSQPVIDQLYNFQPGMVYNYLKVPLATTVDTTLLPSYGTDVTWDLDVLPWEDQIYTDSILSFEQSSQPSAFEQCSFVYKESSDLEQFYRKSNDTLYYMGHAQFNQQFSPNPITIIYPTNYQESGFKFQDIETDVPWNDTWTYSGRYNAYGTMILSGIEYPNTALYVVSGGKDGQRYTDYMWVNEGDILPKVRIQFVETNSSFTVHYAYGLASAVLSTENNTSEKSFSLYPNPSKGDVFITGGEQKNILVRQYDTSGRFVAEQKFFNESTSSFHLEGDPGMYILQISSEKNELEQIRVIKR